MKGRSNAVKEHERLL